MINQLRASRAFVFSDRNNKVIISGYCKVITSSDKMIKTLETGSRKKKIMLQYQSDIKYIHK